MLENIGTWRPDNWDSIKRKVAENMGIRFLIDLTYIGIMEQIATTIMQAYDVSDEFKERAQMEMEG